MDLVIELSKENLELAIYETKSVVSSDIKIYGNFIICSGSLDDAKRLAYAKRIYSLVFVTKFNNKEDICDLVKKVDWESTINKPYVVRVHDKLLTEREIAKLVWNCLSSPKVNLKNPMIEINFLRPTSQLSFLQSSLSHLKDGRIVKDEEKNEIICEEDNCIVKDAPLICAMLLHKNDNLFLQRKAHLRPALHPSSLSPRLAKAIINLTGLKKGTILDPFCGSGGILIEAGLLGFKLVGTDIDREMINRAKINLNYYALNAELSCMDALDLNGEFDAIVTDLPYGKNTIAYGDLYRDFFFKSYDLSKRAIVMLPFGPSYYDMIGKWNIEAEFSYYLHRTLSKKILVLSH